MEPLIALMRFILYTLPLLLIRLLLSRIVAQNLALAMAHNYVAQQEAIVVRVRVIVVLDVNLLMDIVRVE